MTSAIPQTSGVELLQKNLHDARICHVISGDLWGGAEAQALGLIQGLAVYARLCAVVFNYGELHSRLEQTRIQVDVTDEKVSGIPALVWRLYWIFKRQRPDLIHVHGFKENLVAGLVARLLGIPIVRTHHGRGMIGAKKRYTYIEQFNARFLADRQIAVSRDLSEFLRRNGLSLRKLHVIRNGIDSRAAGLQNSSSRTSGFRGGQSFNIGTVGRLVAVKNHGCLLDAFKRVCDEMASAKLIIVGDGPLTDSLKARAAGLGIADKVTFAGFQQDVDQYLVSLDVFVLSSLHEGIPISLLEAMDREIPVVCTRVGGIPEIITDRHNGLLVKSDDAQALATAILTLAGDRSLGHQLAANARAAVSSELSFERCLIETLSLYGGMISK